jgi:YD repeat-containing protein
LWFTTDVFGTMALTYDPTSGAVATVTDREGRVTTYTTDEMGRVTEVEDAASNSSPGQRPGGGDLFPPRRPEGAQVQSCKISFGVSPRSDVGRSASLCADRHTRAATATLSR